MGGCLPWGWDTHGTQVACPQLTEPLRLHESEVSEIRSQAHIPSAPESVRLRDEEAGVSRGACILPSAWAAACGGVSRLGPPGTGSAQLPRASSGSAAARPARREAAVTASHLGRRLRINRLDTHVRASCAVSVPGAGKWPPAGGEAGASRKGSAGSSASFCVSCPCVHPHLSLGRPHASQLPGPVPLWCCLQEPKLCVRVNEAVPQLGSRKLPSALLREELMSR